MPYIIAVLALIILGTGYTLFQNSDSPLSESSDTETVITMTETGSSTDPLVTPTTTNKTKSPTNTATEPKPNTTPSPSNSNNPTNSPTPAPVAPTPTPAPADSNTYTNGTYSARKSYRTPDGTYEMNVSVTVQNDKVTDSSLSFDSRGAGSGYSKRFTSGYQSQVIGKDLGSINLSRVSGASLTTNAYNSALADIKSQAS
jgi:outer membrane biosynthesis protein TonB